MPRHNLEGGVTAVPCPPPRSTSFMRRHGMLPPRNNPHYLDVDGRDHRFTQEDTERRASERGAVIEPSTPRTLQIDIDGPEAYERFGDLLDLYCSCPTLPRLGMIVERESRTPGNKHITIELDGDLPVQTRILLQALLGSDLKREMLSLASYLNGHENPIVFYRPSEDSNAASPRPGDGTDPLTGSECDLLDIAF